VRCEEASKLRESCVGGLFVDVDEVRDWVHGGQGRAVASEIPHMAQGRDDTISG
jgi:hypothetical protein